MLLFQARLAGGSRTHRVLYLSRWPRALCRRPGRLFRRCDAVRFVLDARRVVRQWLGGVLRVDEAHEKVLGGHVGRGEGQGARDLHHVGVMRHQLLALQQMVVASELDERSILHGEDALELIQESDLRKL